MAINKMRVGTLALGLWVCILLFVSVQSAPQLFYDDAAADQMQIADDFPVEVEELPEQLLPLTRTRRGSQIASFGHHNNVYSGHGSGGSGGSGGGGGHGHGWNRGRVGPVFTYVRTDHHGNYQFGVRHTTGGQGWGR